MEDAVGLIAVLAPRDGRWKGWVGTEARLTDQLHNKDRPETSRIRDILKHDGKYACCVEMKQPSFATVQWLAVFTKPTSVYARIEMEPKSLCTGTQPTVLWWR